MARAAGRRRRPIRARKPELERIAEVCAHVPAHAPRDFWEALQYYWFVHLGVTTELNTWDAFCPGRLDQHLLPFYRRGLADGTLTASRPRSCCSASGSSSTTSPRRPRWA
ncbi:MAG: pyruvate formate lyase family protein [Candidatus Moduliflexus flocculans]|nr:pyruvate formate lyase family protein [Candidatus Moduliflexus flocculans]